MQVQRAGSDIRVHSSAVEHGIADPGVAGSIPAAPWSRLAQLVERKTLNLVVVGSIPTEGAFLVYPQQSRRFSSVGRASD